MSYEHEEFSGRCPTCGQEFLKPRIDALEELARVKKAISESCDEQRGEYFGCRRAERAEAALAEAERKGREAGLREAAALCTEYSAKLQPYAERDYTRDDAIAQYCADAILAAIWERK